MFTALEVIFIVIIVTIISFFIGALFFILYANFVTPETGIILPKADVIAHI